jgi:hypothetical protein
MSPEMGGIWRLLAVSGLTLAGCKDSPGPEEPFATGQRLRAEVLDGGSGARSFLIWYDRQLGQRCQFATAEDGETRCMPTNELVAGRVHLEPLCQDAGAVLVATESNPTFGICPGPVPGYFSDVVGSTPGPRPCGSPATLRLAGYRVLARLPQEAAPEIYVEDGGRCTARPRPQGRDLHAIERVSSKTFVAGRERRRMRQGEVARIFRVAEDTSMELEGLFDEPHDAPCRPETKPGPPGPTRCLPDAVDAGPLVFFDAACRELGTVGPFDCTAPYVRLDQPPSGPVFFRNEGARTAATLYDSTSPGVCRRSDGDFAGATLVKLGPLLRAESFPELLPGHAGLGRLRLNVHTSANLPVIPIRGGGFRDTERNEDCWATLTQGGKLLCLPRYLTVGESPYAPIPNPAVFLDPTCQRELIATGERASPPSPPDTVAVRWTLGGCGREISEILSLGEPVPAGTALYTRMPGGACLPESLPDERIYRELTAPLPFATFATVEHRRD